MSAPTTTTAWGPATCGCGCRPARATSPGCGCQQCQPGQGINFEGRLGIRATARRLRIQELLKLERKLTEDEERELDDLLHWYIHR